MTSVERKIYDVIKENAGLKGREIASILEMDKRDVNSTLSQSSALKRLVYQKSDYCWYLKDTSNEAGSQNKENSGSSDVICEVCGHPMVVKKGRFGQFLGCSQFPNCTFTKPLPVEMPGKCPNCGSHIVKRTSKKGYVFYCCERGTECGFVTWDIPLKDDCPQCGKTLFKASGRSPLNSFCINEACPAFVPEEKRRYPKKKQ